MPSFLTACPRNCYSTCSMRVTVEAGRVVAIENVPDNLATPQGPCLKGLSYVERASSPERVVTPLLRRASGFTPVPWPVAIDLVATALERARREHGPQSVLFYAGSGTKGLLNGCSTAFWRLFGGCTTTYGDLCWPAGLEATRLTLGDNAHNAPWDLVNARLVVFWGKNAAETNVHQMAHLAKAVERGARVVVVDPRRTETAERADLHVRPRPGTDGALALGVAHLLVRDAHVDRAFVDTHVHGFAEYEALLRETPPEWAAEVCEVPLEEIRELARLVGTLHPLTIVPGFGMQRFTNSGQAMRAILSLLALTGQIGKPGAGWVYANLQTAVFHPVKDPLDFYPPEVGDGVVRVGVSTARLGRDMLALENPRLSFAWVERGNPIPQNPATPLVLEAFRKLDFRVVVDEFLTDTAREADVVLPAKNLFEQTDVVGAYWHPYLQLRRKVVEPPPGVKPETEVYRALGRRLGISEEALAEALPGPTDADVEAWLEQKLAPLGLTLDRLKEGPVLAPGAKEVAFDDLGFPTPSGKIELRSAEARGRWGLDELPRYTEPVESARNGGKYPLHFLTPNTKNRIHSQFGNLETIRRIEPAPALAMHPDDAAGRGLAEGALARVFNDRGSLTLPVALDWGLKQGCVCVPNGWWLSDGGAVNVLSEGRETDMGYGAAFHDNLVEVARA